MERTAVYGQGHVILIVSSRMIVLVLRVVIVRTVLIMRRLILRESASASEIGLAKVVLNLMDLVIQSALPVLDLTLITVRSARQTQNF